MSNFEEEVEDLIGVRPTGWTFHPSDDLEHSARIWFAYTPSKDKPEGQPLSWGELKTLHEAFTIVFVESYSHGKTGSRLCVAVAEP